MEHVSEEGGGKISTEERRLPSYPPTTSCPDAKIVKDGVMRKETANDKDEESFCFFLHGVFYSKDIHSA